MSPLELNALGAVAVDYESVETILGELEHDLHRAIQPSELFGVLCSLAERHLVAAYIYDPLTKDYVAAPPRSRADSEIWFRATPLGRREHEQLVA